MQKKYKKQKGMFSDMQSYSVGLTGLGITTAVGAGVAAHAPAGTPSLTGGFSTMASFTPVMGTMVGAGSVLKQTKKLKKYY